MNEMDKDWKERHRIWQKQCEIAEDIKAEFLKKAQTEHQKNIIKEIINDIKRKYRF